MRNDFSGRRTAPLPWQEDGQAGDLARSVTLRRMSPRHPGWKALAEAGRSGGLGKPPGGPRGLAGRLERAIVTVRPVGVVWFGEMRRAALALVATTLTLAACGSSHPGHAGPPTPGTVASTPAQAAIARVQASKSGGAFRIFPQDQVRLGCRIPGPGLALRGIKGTCESRVRFADGSRTAVGAVVTFTEFWPARLFRVGGSPKRTLQHSWRFEVQANGIRGLGDHGALPPQAAD